MSDVGARRWWAVAALVLASMAVGFDVTILSLALPAMADDLGANNVELQWFVTSYTLVFAAGMIPAGMLGDRFGRKKVLLVALVIFGVSSLACAYATSSGVFIAGRAVLGLGGALIMPTILALLPVMFSDEERPKAIGAVAGAAMLAYPLGPILGGYLLNHFWWGSVFLINVPVVILAFLAVRAWLPESKASEAKPFDVGGLVLSSAGLAAMTYGVIQGGEKGWTDVTVLATILGGLLALVAFVLWEKRTPDPLVDLSLFRSARFTSGTMLGTVINFTMFGVLFTMPQYYQAILGTDAMGSGFRLLPMVGGLLVGVTVANRIAKAMGPKAAVGLGFALLGAALFYGATTDVGSGTGLAAAWTAAYGLGLGLALPTAMDAALGALSEDSAGVGSGVNQSIRTLGGSFGAAILGSILNSKYRGDLELDGLPDAAQDAAKDSVFGGLGVARAMESSSFADSVRSAFVGALDVVLVVSGFLGLLGVLLAVVWLPSHVGQSTPQPAESEHDAADTA
ncbi:DHA2 family multidrug resistance protein-like MFS transporter [Streptomyces aurantiacus]|uniref:DHA2 family efflux MFS transporter permease subunit n=1 Tax=Streptomyces aurantiacus TaxID=47760 RepID=UPI00278D5583|nr:DHA2 family efflux MFS transporter permease subunit [Streptomyces aurantiacus]MDQ0772852.1 DHA2 family multidrug resistance protein-like MFS transporter [Streptomyces aurantiacus]